MKKIFISVVVAMLSCAVFAQNSVIEEPNPETVGNDSANK